MDIQKLKSRGIAFCKNWAPSIVAAILIATSFKSAIADWNDVPTGSMIPTILIGDRVFINKLSYGLKIPYTTFHLARWDIPKRGDIVVFYSPKDGKRLIKRLIGLPGDRITSKRNRLTINGEPLQYSIMDIHATDRAQITAENHEIVLLENLGGRQHSIMVSQSRDQLDSFSNITVPKDSVFVMGDNRNNSADSRVFGFVDVDKVVGRATTIVLSRDGSFLNPRWDRFFQKLR